MRETKRCIFMKNEVHAGVFFNRKIGTDDFIKLFRQFLIILFYRFLVACDGLKVLLRKADTKLENGTVYNQIFVLFFGQITSNLSDAEHQKGLSKYRHDRFHHLLQSLA